MLCGPVIRSHVLPYWLFDELRLLHEKIGQFHSTLHHITQQATSASYKKVLTDTKSRAT